MSRPSGIVHQPNILIVDDTPANLRLLASMLKDRGYKARPVPNGRLALQAAQKDPPDLILLDIGMPEMDGYEVCGQLKADERLKNIPVIFLSALTDTVDKVKAFNVGGVDYVSKPFQFEEVEARIETHLTIQRQRMEVERLHREQEAFLRHELSNYLGAVQNLSDLLLDSAESFTEKQLKWLTAIRSSADRMMALVREIKKLQDFESGVFSLKSTPCDIQPLLDSVIANLEATLADARLELEVNAENTMVSGDVNLLTGVFQNLMKNALEHVADLEDPADGTVKVIVADKNGDVIVSVNNKGEPIPRDRLPYFFEKFNRQGIKKGGTGLGTTYAYLVTLAHGGEIAVSSSDAEGTTVTVTLAAVSDLPAVNADGR